jgi:multicomponent Na+:H+ antiporter subunit F
MIAIYFFYVFVLAAIVLATIRALLGPTVADRVVAVDALTTITTVLMVVLGLVYHREIYLDVGLVYAVLAFMGVLIVARYMEGGL